MLPNLARRRTGGGALKNIEKRYNPHNMNISSPYPETLPEKLERVFNVASNSFNPTEAALSNLARSPFELDGRCYESVEGFWQGLKFPDDVVREGIAAMHGIASKKVGN